MARLTSHDKVWVVVLVWQKIVGTPQKKRTHHPPLNFCYFIIFWGFRSLLNLKKVSGILKPNLKDYKGCCIFWGQIKELGPRIIYRHIKVRTLCGFIEKRSQGYSWQKSQKFLLCRPLSRPYFRRSSGSYSSLAMETPHANITRIFLAETICLSSNVQTQKIFAQTPLTGPNCLRSSRSYS